MPSNGKRNTRMIDGVLHRWRRDRWVPIPEKWLGKIPHRQTARKQPSPNIHKRRKSIKHQGGYGPRLDPKGKKAPTIEEFLE